MSLHYLVIGELRIKLKWRSISQGRFLIFEMGGFGILAFFYLLRCFVLIHDQGGLFVQ